MRGFAASLMFSILILRQLQVNGEAEQVPRRQVLVLGGNGFIGSTVVSRLIQEGKDNITIVNRGNWYWDSGERIVPHVTHVYCDRHERVKDKCYDFMDYIKDKKFDFVLDFSSYNGNQALNMVQVLQGKVGTYLMISTDSVYDVCDKKHDLPTKETDSIRPEQIGERDLLAKLHRYGHNKLEAEEALIEQRPVGGFPFVILRLPDVIGPRDTTYRWWIYQLWIKLSPQFDDHPVTLPTFLKEYPMSFVYSEDVATAVAKIMAMGPQIKDQVINLAWPEPFYMKDLYESIQEEIGMEKGGFVEIPDSDAFYLYPTVRKGPIDVTKAQSLLEFEPTPKEEAIKTTVQFYEKAFKDYVHQRNEIIQVVASQLFEDHQSKFYEGLEKAYGVDLSHFKNPKDEL